MKKVTSCILGIGLCIAVATQAHARDDKHLLPIATAMQGAGEAKDKLEGNIKFYFGSQKHPKILANYGSDTANRKTNAFGKSDDTACNWAFLAAMVGLERAAKNRGANAVVNVRSNYKKDEFSSPTEFECHAGAIMAGVALKGDFVKIADK
jgi:uncharacterized protein YbjQ (UPF0145 family)